jgi:hypothetical protein
MQRALRHLVNGNPFEGGALSICLVRFEIVVTHTDDGRVGPKAKIQDRRLEHSNLVARDHGFLVGLSQSGGHRVLA